MDDFEQVLLKAAKDAFNVLTENGGSKEEVLATIKDMYDSSKRSAEFKQELEALEEKLASKEQELASLDKENSLDDLIKGAVEKTEDQPIKNNPVKEMER